MILEGNADRRQAVLLSDLYSSQPFTETGGCTFVLGQLRFL